MQINGGASGIVNIGLCSFIPLSVRNVGKPIRILYQTNDQPTQSPVASTWPFQSTNPTWLYDEIDITDFDSPSFVHRILWSDGAVWEIPFTDVKMESVTPPNKD